MLDRYTHGSVDRLCPDAPAPVLQFREQRDVAGGAANVAMNARALGAAVTLIAPFGADNSSRELRTLLQSQGVEVTDRSSFPSRTTLVKERLVADNRVLMRVDRGTTEPLEEGEAATLLHDWEALACAADVVILSDYGYGTFTPGAVRRLSRGREACTGILAVDSKRLERFARLQPTVVKPNYHQALGLLRQNASHAESRADFIAMRAAAVLARSGADIAAVTLDCDGAVICHRGAPPFRTFCRHKGSAHVCGAGDSFLAAYCLALAAGGSSVSAAEIASAAAAVVVRQSETAVCSWREVEETLTCGRGACLDLHDLRCYAERLRAQGRRIVLTCGCFDLLHRGHITYLQQAKALGDILVVGVNCDESIARLKGPERPINTLADRLDVLASMSCIDHLVPFAEDTPHRLIESLRPDVFVKGGDYTRDRLPEAELVESLGGRVEILPYVSNRSTTGIIDRIRQNQASTSDLSSCVRVRGDS
jgi:D-beta-D-heptose 7-phosphate kinase/D-beta-D-heptose 1-phosphate adenosyltransferase